MKVYLTIFLLACSLLNGNYHSQYLQDQFLNEYIFCNKKGGVFLEVGGGDGVTDSNTYFFERELEWKGLIVEPIPEQFERLCSNRSCYCENTCLGSERREKVPFLQLSGRASGLSGIIDLFEPKGVERIERWLENGSTTSRVIHVNVCPLSELLDSYEISHIDYFSLDTEGSELDILKAIDFDKYTIDVLTIENNFFRPEINEYMTGKGYVRIVRLKNDEIFVRKALLNELIPLPEKYPENNYGRKVFYEKYF